MKFSRSDIIAVAAVIVASSGGAFAAGSSINGQNIQNGTIGMSKLAPSVQRAIAQGSRHHLQTVTVRGIDQANCPAGYVVTGGGISAPVSSKVFSTYPLANSQSWVAQTEFGHPFSTFAQCARIR